MPFVLAPKPGEREGDVGVVVVRDAGTGVVRRERGEVGAGCGAGFVGAVGAVAEVVVEAGDGEGEVGGRDAGEGCRGFVKFGDWMYICISCLFCTCLCAR